ncbi:SDR family oxidoreductase [Myroides indicus]|uniref:NADP-dependent 3-hydroxy acid dehydrogenase YdfG n=1 Tax=Myroides indicus TaxID=1323422 RepID=A0A4R7FCD0_9FLAO|nr:SDR family oxidoreductase [Myroides indicus]TDS65099.1 NADP-dependent 3-hydroxy acid dehydrogenase YdfG [Myroides indicus]
MEKSVKKVAYITGGTKGIGRGIAYALLQNNYRIALSGRNYEMAKEIAQSLGSSDNVLPIQSDVKNFDDEQNAINKIIEHFGQLDVVIANAGIGIFKPVEDLKIEDWHTMIDTNLTGTFYTLKASIAELKKTKGYFISIASLAGINFFATASGYNASKFGVVGFTQAAMLDLRDSDIKITTILPGSVSTYFNNNEPSEKDAWKIQPEDIGELVVDILKLNPRVLPSKIEIRPSKTK